MLKDINFNLSEVEDSSENENESEVAVLQEKSYNKLTERMIQDYNHWLKNVKVYVKVFTPAMLLALVNKGENFRHKTLTSIEKYGKLLLEDKWCIGPIIFIDEDGNLLDGQNRCWAGIESNSEMIFLVVENVKKELTTAIDIGKTRTTNEVVKNAARTDTRICEIQGASPTAFITSTLKAICDSHAGSSMSETILNPYIVDEIKKHDEVLKFLVGTFYPTDANGKKGPKTKGITRAYVVSVFGKAYLFYKNNPEQLAKVKQLAKAFKAGYFDGVGSESETQAIRSCREWLLSETDSFNGANANKVFYRTVSTLVDKFLKGKKCTWRNPQKNKKLTDDFQDPFPLSK